MNPILCRPILHLSAIQHSIHDANRNPVSSCECVHLLHLWMHPSGWFFIFFYLSYILFSRFRLAVKIQLFMRIFVPQPGFFLQAHACSQFDQAPVVSDLNFKHPPAAGAHPSTVSSSVSTRWPLCCIDACSEAEVEEFLCLVQVRLWSTTCHYSSYSLRFYVQNPLVCFMFNKVLLIIFYSYFYS